jgi:hypothetical protein
VGPQRAIRSPNFRVYDSFLAPMQMELVNQVPLRSDGVVRNRGGREELASAFGTCSHHRDLAFESHDDEAAALRCIGCAVFNLQFVHPE